MKNMTKIYKQIIIFLSVINKLIRISSKKKIILLFLFQFLAFGLLLLFFKNVKEININAIETFTKPILFFISLTFINFIESRFRYSFSHSTSSRFHLMFFEENEEFYMNALNLFKTKLVGNVMITARVLSSFLIIPLNVLIISYISIQLLSILNISIIFFTLLFMILYVFIYYMNLKRILHFTKKYDDSRVRGNEKNCIDAQKPFFVNIRTNSEFISIINISFIMMYAMFAYQFFKDDFMLINKQSLGFELFFFLLIFYRASNLITKSLAVSLRFFKIIKFISFLNK